MIEIDGLTKRYGDKTAVDRLSFVVEPGVVTGFLGPNGAGKSTTMRVIAGLDRPTSGTVRVNGKHYPEAAAPMSELGILLDARSVHPGLSARSNLLALARTAGIGRRRVDEVIELAGLAEVAEDTSMSFWTPVENPGTRPTRSWVFDIGCALFAAAGVVRELFLRPDTAPSASHAGGQPGRRGPDGPGAVTAPGLARPGVRRHGADGGGAGPVAGPGRAVPGRAGHRPVHRRGHDEPGHGDRRGRRSRWRPRSPRPARAAGTTAGWP